MNYAKVTKSERKIINSFKEGKINQSTYTKKMLKEFEKGWKRDKLERNFKKAFNL